MAKVFVSNNSELLRHLSAPMLRGLGLAPRVMASGAEIAREVASDPPRLAILDAEMPELSGYEVAARIKAGAPECKVILVVGKRIESDQMRRVAASGCDEVLVAPMSADELYDAVAIQLGLPRRGSEGYRVTVSVVEGEAATGEDTGGEDTREVTREIGARVTNLSVDGARLVTSEPLAESTRLVFEIRHDPTAPGASPPEHGGHGGHGGHQDAGALTVRARVVWSQPSNQDTVVGAAFEAMDDALRQRLSRLVHWEIVEDTERTRVVIKGDITEATSFDDLLPLLVGRVDFDLSQVRYINSLGVRTWIEFLRAAQIQGYEFHACSIAFILQASVIDDMVGRGTITSFFAPYHCEGCERQAEKLLQSAAILASEDREPPVLTCSGCGGAMVLDDLPDRYLAFLLPTSEPAALAEQ